MKMAGSKRGQPVHILLAKQLGVSIVAGPNGPGTVLPGEIQLAERHGVSRSVIRESLRMLSAKGLVESKPKAGTKVRERSDWNLLDPQLLGWMFEGAPPLDFVHSLVQLRLIVEPAAAELAATKRTADQLSRMGHALEEMRLHGLATEAGRTGDQNFHAVILQATANELLISLSASIAAAVRWTTFFRNRGAKHPRDPWPEHKVLFEAIADANATGAREATAVLVKQAQRDIELALDEELRRATGTAHATEQLTPALTD